MATADSVKAKLQNLLQSANTATGNTDGNLTDAMASLIAGFGSGAAMYTGIYTAAERVVEDVTFDTPGGVSNFALFMMEIPVPGTGNALMTAIMGCKSTKRVICAASNATGSTITASQHYLTGRPTVSNYPGISFEENKVILLAPSSPGTNSRWLQVNKPYIWIGW